MADHRVRPFLSVSQRRFWPASVVLALFGFLGANTPAQATNVSGVISTDTTWTAAGRRLLKLPAAASPSALRKECL